MLPIIFGFSGHRLTVEERQFFRDTNPFGYIIFRRNVDTPEQVQRLTDEIRDLCGRDDVPILIDQEGGRVQRLRPPHWVDLPNMRQIGDLFARNSLLGLQAAKLQAQIIAGQLCELGINTVCAPVADVPTIGAHDVIGDRAFSRDVAHIIPLAATMAKELLHCGVMPIMKHVPGHGRADTDSHYACPVVTADRETLNETDFRSFKQIALQAGAENIWGMTAHVVFTAIDQRPASVSKPTLDMVRHDLGVTGPLIADAVEMEALGGTLAERAVATISAGCDSSLHCTGKLDEMRQIAEALPPMSDISIQRFALAEKARVKDVGNASWRDRFAELQTRVAVEDFDMQNPHDALTTA